MWKKEGNLFVSENKVVNNIERFSHGWLHLRKQTNEKMQDNKPYDG